MAKFGFSLMLALFGYGYPLMLALFQLATTTLAIAEIVDPQLPILRRESALPTTVSRHVPRISSQVRWGG